MFVHDIISKPGNHISFEFFPPKTDGGTEKLFEVIADLSVYKPDFCSVTWGAGGRTVGNTIDIVSKIKKMHGLEGVAHFTGLGMTPAIVDEMLQKFKDNGIQNALVLRGDIPHNMSKDEAFKGGFQYANELVKYIRQKKGYLVNDFGILVAGSPEGHPEATSFEDDVTHLVNKVSEGASGIVTQFFLDNDKFYRFVKAVQQKGCMAPIMVGIMTITKVKMISKMIQMSNCAVPSEVKRAIAKYENDDASMEAFGIDFTCRQIQDLLNHGTKHFHFYTLNQSRATSVVLDNMNGSLVNRDRITL